MSAEIQLDDTSLLRTDCYVNGEWREAKSGKRFDVNNPSTTKNIASCPEFSKDDTLHAINAAHAAFPSFRKTTPAQRAQWLRRWHALMLDHAADLAALITHENGKPLADARGEVAYAAGFLDWFAGEAARIYGDTITASDPSRHRLLTLKQPVGPCALIAPWNFPAAMITRKVGPALAAGCTVVVKAPGEAPLSALALAELARRAGVPPGVINVVTALGNTAEVGEVLTTHPLIRKLSFTGSTAVGRLLLRQSASTVKKCSMELGGNAPFVVFDDADLAAAVEGLVACKFRVSGQTCVCANRILVQRGVHEEFVSALLERVKSFRVGDGFAEGTTHGPLIHGRAVGKVDAHVRDAVAKGATVLAGGKTLLHLGPNFYDVTVLTGMRPGMRICEEETFGPVAAVFVFDTEEEAIRMANDSEVGLGGYFFSRDVGRCWRVAEALDVGMVGVNTGAISDPVAPFGGIKQSGIGREGSKYGIDEFLVIKTVMAGINF